MIEFKHLPDCDGLLQFNVKLNSYVCSVCQTLISKCEAGDHPKILVVNEESEDEDPETGFLLHPNLSKNEVELYDDENGPLKRGEIVNFNMVCLFCLHNELEEEYEEALQEDKEMHDYWDERED